MKTLIIAFGVLLSGKALAVGLTLEQRTLEFIKNEEQTNQYLKDLRFKIQNADQLDYVGKEFTVQTPLLGYRNITPGFIGLPVTENINDKNGFIVEAEGLNTFEKRITSIKAISPLTTTLTLYKIGEKFTVKDFIANHDKNLYRFIVQDEKGQIYEMLKEKIERYFINSTAKNSSYLIDIYEKNLEKNSSVYKIRYCLPIQADSNNKMNSSETDHYIKNAEEFDPKLLDWINFTDSEFKIAFEKLSGNNRISYDPYTLSTTFTERRICYGIYANDTQSFLNMLILLPKVITGHWVNASRR